MLKTRYIELFNKVRALPLDTACAPMLANLCYGYRQLLLISYADPRFTEDFGEAAKPLVLTGTMLQVIDKLADNLNQELQPGEWARNIVYLLEALTFQYNGRYMEVARNAMEDFFSTCAGREGLEEDLCKIWCYKYYFRSDKEAARKAKNMVDGWVKELPVEGVWSHLTPDRSLERLESMVLYAETVDSKHYRKQTDVLIKHFSRAEGLDNQVRFLFIAVRAGLWLTYREEVLRILEKLLKVELPQEGSVRLQQPERAGWKTARCKNEPLLQAIQFHMLGLYWNCEA